MKKEIIDNEKIYNDFIKKFPEYKELVNLKEAFFTDDVEGFKGIFLGLYYLQGIVDAKAILESNVLGNDEVSISLLKYDLKIKQEKDKLLLRSLLRR